MKEIDDITNALLHFRNERDWEQFHNPKDLALAINVEAGELLELFLWKDSKDANIEKVKEELADVFAFAFLLAEKYNLDVKEIVLDKIKKNAVPLPILRYTFEVLEDIRKQLLVKERYGMLTPKGTLLIKGYQKHIIIPEMGMLKINLTPLERAVYLLFLNHAEGIRLSEMSQYKTELTDLVKRLSRSDNPTDISYSIDALCLPDSNSLSEKLARIRNKFNKHLGEEMAAQYIVSGPNGGLKRINLDREHLSIMD